MNTKNNILVLLMALYLLLPLNHRGQETQIIINSTLDTGDADLTDGLCDDGNGNATLRAAIEQANYSQQPTGIYFNIPGDGPHIIQPATSLPVIDVEMKIYGSSQPGSIQASRFQPPVYMIVLDGSLLNINNVSGLIFSSSANNSRIMFMKIQKFGSDEFVGNAIQLHGQYIEMQECFLCDNSSDAILITGSNNIVGGYGGSNPGYSDRNTISGNGNGIAIFPGANDNYIIGNFIGTDVYGMNDATDGWDGISIGGNGNRIEFNLIGGYENNGVLIQAWDDQNIPCDNLILGNKIGLNNEELDFIPNGQGVSINHGDNNTIQQNKIIDNRFHGILISDQDFEWNHINSQGNLITQNTIWGNGGLGIDLGNDWVSMNDYGDCDVGPNGLINYPFIESAYLTSEGLVVKGCIDTESPRYVTIEFFNNQLFDEIGFGEGQTYIGSATPDNRGRFNVLLPSLPLGTVITATATDAGNNTSEFSQYAEVLKLDETYQPTYNIYSYDLRDGTTTRLTNHGLASEYNPAYSRMGNEIVYDVWDGYHNRLGITNVWTGISKYIDGSYDANDAIFADEQTILFDDWNNIYKVCQTTGEIQMIVSDAITPQMRFNGKRLLFYRPSDGSIRSVNYKKLDDEKVLLNSVTHQNWRGARPSWSPNGKWVVYYDEGLWKIQADRHGNPRGQPEPVILNGEFVYQDARFLKNSKTLVLHSNHETGNFDIWTISLDGNDLTRLTGEPGTQEFNPSVSFNGRYIIYSSNTTSSLSKRNTVTIREEPVPLNFALDQNYPNPFNPSTTISFSLPEKGNVKLVIFDLLGREVSTLINETKEMGDYKITYDAINLPSGVYLYQLKFHGKTITRKMSLIK